MNNLSIRYKLLLSFLLIAILFLPISFYTMHAFKKINLNFAEIVNSAFPRVQALLEMRTSTTEVSDLISNLEFYNGSEQIAAKKNELLAYLSEVDKWQKAYQTHLPSNAKSKLDAKEFTELRDKVIFVAIDAFNQKEKLSSKEELANKKQQLIEAENNFNHFIKNAVFEEILQLEKIQEKGDQNFKAFYRILILSNTIIIMLAVAMSLFLAHFISSPIIQLKNFAGSIREKNTSKRAKVNSKDEIGQLANNINHMLDSLAKTETKLLEVSHQAGKAEVATSILHNVGNVLNSINVSTALLKDNLNRSKQTSLNKLVVLFEEHFSEIENYLHNDPQGKLLLPYLQKLTKQLEEERTESQNEVSQLMKNLEHVNNIIALQQTDAKTENVEETINLSALINDTLSLYIKQINNANIKIEKNIDLTAFKSVRSKLQQILINLIKNAMESLCESNNQDKALNITTSIDHDNWLTVSIKDSGMGIDRENAKKIFSFGYTTKTKGHGYGLHNCALLAKELGGELTVKSDGANQGATFILKIPVVDETMVAEL